MNQSYPALVQFFGGYFHEDWPLEAASWEEVVEIFLKAVDRDTLVSVRDELDRLRSHAPDEESIGNALFELGCCYAPSGGGLTSNEWLDLVQRRLANATAP